VRSFAECEVVLADRPVESELSGIGEVRRIAICRAPKQERAQARRKFDSAEFGVGLR